MGVVDEDAGVSELLLLTVIRYRAIHGLTDLVVKVVKCKCERQAHRK